MSTLTWIILSTLAISLISWVGLILIALGERMIARFLRVIVAFAAGTLMAGALLHLLPEAVEKHGSTPSIYLWLLAGFTVFLLMEQILHWQHDHRLQGDGKSAASYLILMADGLHNFLGGIAIGGSFLVGPEVGLITCLVAAAHEIPQEIGDFAILIDGGWKKQQALVLNFLSALTILPGGLVAYYLSDWVNTGILLPFAAGNFIYIAASDLIPEIKHSENTVDDLINFTAFVVGMGLIYGIQLWVS